MEHAENDTQAMTDSDSTVRHLKAKMIGEKERTATHEAVTHESPLCARRLDFGLEETLGSTSESIEIK